MARKYDPRRDPDDTHGAITMLHHYLQPNKEHPRQIYSTGKCPRCRHEPIDHVHPLRIVTSQQELESFGDVDVAGASTLDDVLDQLLRHGDAEFDITCNCAVPHPKAPPGTAGCGSTFRVMVKW
jgi:hypothetical protein